MAKISKQLSVLFNGCNMYNHDLENKAHNYFGDFTNFFFRCKGYKKLLKIREH